MGEVVRLRVDGRKFCSECEFALFGSGGVYCREINEDIWNERVAEECESFDPVPWARVFVQKGERGAQA